MSNYQSKHTGQAIDDGIDATAKIPSIEQSVNDLGASKIGEAPNDGKQYARQSGLWAEVKSDGSGGALPVNTKYSVLHNGEFTDLFAKEAKAAEEVVDMYRIDTIPDKVASIDVLWFQGAPVGQDHATWYEQFVGKHIRSVSFYPASAGTFTIAYSLNTLSTSGGIICTIDIAAEDIEKKTKYLFDGTDSRVTLNSEILTDGKVVLPPTPWYIGLGGRANAFKYSNGVTPVCRVYNGSDGNQSTTINVNLDVEVATEDFREVYTVPDIAYLAGQAPSSDTNPVVRELRGKTISFIGDSITTFSGAIPSGYPTFYPAQDVTTVEDTYWHQVVADLGLELLQNNAYSGSQLVYGASGSVIQNERYTLLAKDGKTPDIVVVFIGTNDFSYGQPHGEYTGQTAIPEVATTTAFSNAYGYMLANICTLYPNAEVWSCTLLQRNNKNADTFPEVNDNGNTLMSYNDIIKEVTLNLGCKYIDLYACGINHWNIANYLGDDLHPNKAGMKLMAEKIKGNLISNVSG